ncbi:MAG: hypothetical protein BAJATHORv1_30009 [Candidatus Thorarchaeota archaeon]|nr:MAG: hypothetical protein BAJATHORv1_30009 [Candidatus Thorarchaeota archaeon]
MRDKKESLPYPLVVLTGRMRLSGLSWVLAESITQQIRKKNPDDLIQTCIDHITPFSTEAAERFEFLSEFSNSRKEDIPSIILSLEGASATGKSILSMGMIRALSASRIVSTDTIRQVLRAKGSVEKHPELYCHTYQAHRHKQVGDEELNPVVRGFLAQCEQITPTIRKLVKRLTNEGTTGLIEGVHIIPGTLQEIAEGVLEILIHPPEFVHRDMFLSKGTDTKLKTVSKDESIRLSEYEATRKIQNFMLDRAQVHECAIIEMKDFDEAESAICDLVVSKVSEIIMKE